MEEIDNRDCFWIDEWVHSRLWGNFVEFFCTFDQEGISFCELYKVCPHYCAADKIDSYVRELIKEVEELTEELERK